MIIELMSIQWYQIKAKRAQCQVHLYLMLWQYRLWIFQERDTKLESFLAKDQL